MKGLFGLKIGIFAVGFLCMIQTADAQRIALKTNALTWATLAPNLGAEFGISRHFTLGLEATVSPFSIGKKFKPRYMALQPELRYWFTGRAHARWFVGAAGLLSEYNMRLGNTHHDGSAWGGGITGGYSFPLSTRWSMETTLGLGIVRYNEKKYGADQPAPAATNHKKLTIAPIKAGVTFVYILK